MLCNKFITRHQNLSSDEGELGGGVQHVLHVVFQSFQQFTHFHLHTTQSFVRDNVIMVTTPPNRFVLVQTKEAPAIAAIGLGVMQFVAVYAAAMAVVVVNLRATTPSKSDPSMQQTCLLQLLW